jgi:hypothetical protein
MIQVTTTNAPGLWQIIRVFDEVVRIRDLKHWLEDREHNEDNVNIKSAYKTMIKLVEQDAINSMNEALKLLQYHSIGNKGVGYYDDKRTFDTTPASISGGDECKPDAGIKVES